MSHVSKLGLCALLLVAGGAQAAAVPAAVPYVGYLTTEEGAPFEGAVDVGVALYAAAEGGAPVWGPHTFLEIPVEAGVLSLVLGAAGSAPLDGGLLGGGPLWLGVTVDGTLLAPRQEILSVPYALVAGDAERLGGEVAAAFVTGAELPDFSAYVLADALAAVALSGAYDDLTGRPELAGYALSAELQPVCWSGSYSDLEDRPDLGVFALASELATVATSGAYADLSGRPELGVYALSAELQPVCWSGSYGDLHDAPPLDAFLTGDDLAAVAFSGDYADLDGAPELAAYVPRAELAGALAELWCFENCDALRLSDCRLRSCDGAAESCTDAGAAPDGASCGGGVGRCVGGECRGAFCGGQVCPYLPDYRVACNDRDFCEYRYAGTDASAWRERDEWIWVPAGSFPMGRPESESGGTYELPQHEVTIPQGFFVGKYEIVVTAYEACERAGRCTGPSTADWDGAGWGLNRSSNGRQNHPQNGVTWQQAADFCGWVAPGGRLPSEAEWEYAAKGPVHRLYPWGDAPAPSCENDTAVFNEAGGEAGYGCGTGGTWAVGSKPAGTSWCGALDMAGNLWEWVVDWWHTTYDGAPVDGSAWVVPPGTTRVRRGGCFDTAASALRSASRANGTPTSRYAHYGARCLRGPVP